MLGKYIRRQRLERGSYPSASPLPTPPAPLRHVTLTINSIPLAGTKHPSLEHVQTRHRQPLAPPALPHLLCLLVPLDIHPVRSSPGVEEDRDEVQVNERFCLFERFAGEGRRGEEGGDAVE